MDVQSDDSNQWHLWQEGDVLRELPADLPIRPVLESWMAKTHPDQIKLNDYLNVLTEQIGVLPEAPNLFIHLDIEVEARNLLHHHDVENYITPVVRRFGASRFVLATVTKQIGPIPNVKSLRIGYAVPRLNSLTQEWHSFSHSTESSAETEAWKVGIKDALKAQGVAELDKGEEKREVEVILAWRCAPTRKWVSFWKPTGDAMGPVLGEPYADRPFYPNDDRITYLECHWFPDATLKREVDIGYVVA